MSTLTIHHLIMNQAYTRPFSNALIHKDRSITYKQLAELLSNLGQSLTGIGIEKNERIATYLPKTIESVISLFAISSMGAVFVPINPILKAHQVQYILNDCAARVLITSSDRLKTLQNNLQTCTNLDFVILVDKVKDKFKFKFKLNNITLLYLENLLCRKGACLPEKLQQKLIDTDIAAFFYTSGSTGKPKGVVLSHRNLVAGAQSVSQYLHNTSDDKILAVLPFSFDYGFSQLTTALYVGASVVLMDHLFPRDVIKAVETYQITGLAAVPSLWTQLANLPWPEPCSLRYITNSGGSLPVSILNTLQTKLPDVSPFLMYGLTEAFRSTYVPPEHLKTHQDSIGIAIPDAEVLVLRKDGSECADNEAGELVHRGVLVTQGYWNAPEKTARHFRKYAPQEGQIAVATEVWSGDTVRRAKDGYLYFIGRKDGMIKTSGYRVSPNEIEEIIHQSDLVREVVALGIAHPALGQAIVVVATNQYKNDNLNEEIKKLHTFCKKNLPNYMHPAEIIIKTSLPKNQNGKIDRSSLSKEFQSLFQDTHS